MIVADTGAVVALVDADDRHHAALRPLFEEAPDDGLLPWAALSFFASFGGSHGGAALVRESPRRFARGDAHDTEVRWLVPG